MGQDKTSTGKWSSAEHNKFMEALEKYGRNWVKVQKRVKTRTVQQIRSHSQKVFLNMKDEDIDALIGYNPSHEPVSPRHMPKK